MEYWLQAEGTGHYFFYAFPACLLALFVLLKERRVKFLIPSLLITVVIVNPVFYKYWDKFGLYAYWRILWIIPIIPIVAGLIPAVNEKIGTMTIQKSWIYNICKFIITAIGIIGVALGGSFVYDTSRGQFDVICENTSKLPNYVVAIADRLLDLKDRPRVIVQDPIGVYIRQYTGEIDTLYGRNISGTYITTASYDAIIANSILNNPEGDLNSVSQFMLDDGYDYLVMLESQKADSIFELIDTIDGYGIYKPMGTPTVIKERNELGQVVSITTVDEDGMPVANKNGYSTTIYEYDNNGFLSCEVHVNSHGNAVADEKGIAGFQWTYDDFGEVLSERTIGIDGKAIVAHQNYAEIHWVYKDGQIIKESYYDTEGNPAVQIAGYTAVSQIWDEDKLISKTYLGIDGEPVNRNDGYATADWSNGDISFYDTQGSMIALQGINLFKENKTDIEGWSEWMTPDPDMRNCCFRVGIVNLGAKKPGDSYSCQIEIEFKNVSASDNAAFFFCSQGETDGKWDIGNIWNYCVLLNNPPEDDIYRYTKTITIDERIARARNFEIAFRCDNWKSGSFRIRKVKIEKNDNISNWTPGI